VDEACPGAVVCARCNTGGGGAHVVLARQSSGGERHMAQLSEEELKQEELTIMERLTELARRACALREQSTGATGRE
jgi:hypothetical protein